jgi:hypothetical protein
MAAERQRQCADDHDEQLQHASIVAGVVAKINWDEFWRASGSLRPFALQTPLCEWLVPAVLNRWLPAIRSSVDERG